MVPLPVAKQKGIYVNFQNNGKSKQSINFKINFLNKLLSHTYIMYVLEYLPSYAIGKKQEDVPFPNLENPVPKYVVL